MFVSITNPERRKVPLLTSISLAPFLAQAGIAHAESGRKRKANFGSQFVSESEVRLPDFKAFRTIVCRTPRAFASAELVFHFLQPVRPLQDFARAAAVGRADEAVALHR